MKKILVLVLALVMLAGMACAEVAYPIVGEGDEPITLTVFSINKISDNVSNYNETAFFRHLEEATGIHIEWEHPAVSGLQEAMNLLTLRDKLPDIIMCGNLYNGGEYQGVADGCFVDLSEYLPEYGPDYWSLITQSDEYYRASANADGVVPAFRIVKPVADPPYHYMLFNMDMLAKLGCELPVYIADYEPVFQKMLEAGITPYMPPKTGYEKTLMGAFDVREGFMLDADGSVIYGQVQEGFRQYLTLMHDWYEKGYISKDFMASSNSANNTLFDTGAIGTYSSAVVAAYNRGQKAGFEVSAAPFARQVDGQQLHWYDYDISPIVIHNEAVAVISTDCENIDAAVQWLNYYYTEAGSNLACWGVEGEAYNVVDGRRVYTDLIMNNPNLTTTNASYYYKMHVWPKLNEPDVVCHADLLKSEGALNSRLKWANETYFDSAYVLPSVTLSEDDLNTRTEIMSDIETYVNEMTLKFITGEASLDEFDSFVEQVWDSGLQEVLDIMNAAYADYMNIKAPQK